LNNIDFNVFRGANHFYSWSNLTYNSFIDISITIDKLMRRLFSVLFFYAASCSIQATTFDLPEDGSRVIGHNLIVYSHEEDTLLDIARRFGLGFNDITHANPNVDPWIPGHDTPVVIPHRFILPNATRKGIVINLAEMRLYYYPKVKVNERQQVITHPISVGREGWTTPLGKAKITQKRKDPTWTPPESIKKEHLEMGDPLPDVVPAGPDNPLGAYAMRLSMPGYLLHGTNRPYGVGLRVSHGCIRLFPEDIEQLFNIVPLHTPVEIIYQPVKAALSEGSLFLEAHQVQQDIDERQGNNMTPMVKAILDAQDTLLSDEEWPFAEQLVRQHQGVVKAINQDKTHVVSDVWFLHAGVNEETKSLLSQALTTLELEDHFVPARKSARGEIILGPFKTKSEAEQMKLNIKRVSDMQIWIAQLSADVL
jgi:L,D-transpeptidase ErfK/SrfK